MVKEIVGAGQHYRDFLRAQGIDLADFASLFFRCDSQNDGHIEEELSSALKKLASYREHDSQSLLVRNVANTDGSELELLLVPKDCPPLRERRYTPTNELPPDRETYVVQVFRKYEPGMPRLEPVLKDNFDEARRIAIRRVSMELSIDPRKLRAMPIKVTPPEWRKICEQLIIEGRELPEFIVRWADLMGFMRKLKQERLQTLPSTILR